MSNNNMNTNSSEEEELKFECGVCRRKFKSGKALGGHKRMHNITNLKTKTSTSTVNNNDDESSSDGDDYDDHHLCCRLCGKTFPSEKSLFGHMRSHPKRGWRGIDPPPSPKDAPTLSPEDAPPSPPVIWTLTGRRGGARPSQYCSVVVPGMDQDSTKAALDLMMLNAPKDTIFEYLYEDDADEDETLTKKKKTTPKKDYICSVCNKSFTSYQALGGHMSSHNKLAHNNTSNNNNNNNTNNDNDNNDNDNDNDNNNSNDDDSDSDSDNDNHKVVHGFDLNNSPPDDHSS